MSTEVTVKDREVLLDGLKDVRSDSSETAYAIVGHVNNNSLEIELKQTGVNVDELAALLDDTQVMYCLVRLSETFDLSSTVKFVYIRWQGCDVPFAKKGRFGVVSGSVRKYFDPHHVVIEADSRSEITVEMMTTKLREKSGEKSNVLETSELEGRQERGFVQTQTKQSSDTTIGRSNTSTKVANVSSKGGAVSFQDNVAEVIKSVRMDESPMTWALAGYTADKFEQMIEIIDSGENGVDEMTNLLKDDQVCYGLFRLTDLVDGYSTVKFVCITWVGEHVKPMFKAKISTHKGSVESIFLPAHVTIFATELSELTEAVILEKVQAASGTKSNVR